MKTRLLVVLVAVALVSCSKKEEATSGGEGVKTTAEPDDITAPRTDWDTLELTRVDDVVDGIKFSVELPPDLERDTRAADGDIPGYVTWNAMNFLTNPGFTAQVAGMPPADVDAAAAQAEFHTEPATVSRKENVPGGFIVTMHENSKEYIAVEVYRKSKATGKIVRFGVSVRHSGPIVKFDTLKGWMEKVALTFQPQ